MPSLESPDELQLLPAVEPRWRAPRDYTPRHLAERILRSRSALEGERNQVTVRFADVKHSMQLAEPVDAEAERHLRSALRVYTETGAEGHAARLAQELGEADSIASRA